jgi:hypothetical protein
MSSRLVLRFRRRAVGPVLAQGQDDKHRAVDTQCDWHVEPLVGSAHLALADNELVAGRNALVHWNPTLASNAGGLPYVLLFCSGAAKQIAPATQSGHAVQLGQVTSTASPLAWSNIQALVTNCIAAVATAAGFSISAGTNGYIKFPSWLGALIIQWGYTPVSSASAMTPVNFPIAFPNSTYMVALSTGATGQGIFSAVEGTNTLNGFNFGA